MIDPPRERVVLRGEFIERERIFLVVSMAVCVLEESVEIGEVPCGKVREGRLWLLSIGRKEDLCVRGSLFDG
ncbi:hypothetical protein COLO4_20711 [Corchorus olitorius]|uniref:Uncharacterized protein n=1 Tax=Corchorus olitorius TaxID=93759 RepID=A0A1R3IXJ3_9ROSI|nr:hypothetical protein COLO4_20711 [Corchorus olitorius]